MRTVLANMQGDPADPAKLGSEVEYNLARGDFAARRVALKVARQNATRLAGNTIDALKLTLGRAWNPNWTSAGFTNGSLALGKNAVVALNGLRGYLLANAAGLNLPAGITAEALQASIVAAQAAQNAADEAQRVVKAAMQSRDSNRRTLYQRLIHLRRELKLLLAPDDARWYSFGFDRPVDGKLPVPVEQVQVNPGLPGSLRVTWPAAVRAQRYRVIWKVKGAADETQREVTVSDPATLLEGLTSGVTYVIAVAAANKTGDAVATQVDAIAP